MVDDDPSSTTLLAGMLGQWGYADVQVTNESAEAVTLCRRTQPDLVLLDLHMPPPDGLELLLRLPAETRGVPMPILVLTADDSRAARRDALRAGARDFVTKPFDPDEVGLRVRNLLQTRGLAASLRRHRDELEQRVARRTEELELARLETLERLALAAEFRDDDTGEHTRRVARTACLLARALRVPDPDVERLSLAAPLHDVGKIAVPDSVLLKPGKLTRAEYQEVQRHVLVGEEILGGSGSPVLQTAAEIALHHHERWDGRGYPAGLRGNEVPLPARLVAVADVFDALTHRRPYKEAWPLDAAVTEVLDQAAGHFDPDVVAAFATLDHPALLGPVAG
ncbi:MAG: response regulator receiver modulated metal dependent phosphohydrolase [Conexibacter sp.]|nr:response regulator receiver modulated metal dependent phosphohydrolase [Conexibacter sp.]